MSRSPQNPAEAREKGATPKGHGAKSDAVRTAAILAQLTEKSIQLAAARCGVNERTLRRWLAEDEAFKAEYDTARKAIYQAGIARIQALTARGVETLEELLDAKKFPAARLGRRGRWSSFRDSPARYGAHHAEARRHRSGATAPGAVTGCHV